MEHLQIDQRQLGVNFDAEGLAQVLLWAPNLSAVTLLVNGAERLPMHRDDYGYWALETYKLKPGDLYQFDVNGQLRPDPASLSQPDGVHGPSAALNLRDFHWEDDTWNNISLENYILYELHTGTFTDGGDFEGIGEKLDHLRELGVNAIEIMPVAQFPGTRNWGYDGVFPFAVQNSYGGAPGLQRLVNLCHQKGLAVVLDVVYNHFGPEGNYLGEYGPYLTDKYATPWGKAVNFDDEWCDGVRHYFIENALMWFRDFHIDALRLDAVHAIKDFSPTHILKEIKENVDRLMEQTGRRHYLVVELDLNDTRFIEPLKEHGYGMDAQWIDEFHHALRVTAGEKKQGYYSDFDGILHLGKAYRDAYVYDGQFSPHRKKTFGIKAETNPGKQFVVFSQNHDQVGNRMMGERTSQLVSFEMLKLLAGAVFVSPYLPMLFMGEEWGESNPFLYFVSHTDMELAKAVTEGRRQEFKAFHAAGEAPDPMDEQTFSRSKLQWELLKKEKHNVLFQFYKKLIRLRNSSPVLSTPDRHKLNVEIAEQARTLVLHRWQGDQHILALMNMSVQKQKVNLPGFEPRWVKVFDSASPEFLGPAAAPSALPGLAPLELQPESFLIYSNAEKTGT